MPSQQMKDSFATVSAIDSLRLPQAVEIPVRTGICWGIRQALEYLEDYKDRMSKWHWIKKVGLKAAVLALKGLQELSACPDNS